MARERKQDQSCAVKRKTSIGGQALIEGIMMRGPKKTAMAVRDTEGKIVFEEWENKKNNRPKITKVPVIRGVFGFIDSMVTGYKCLMRSAELSGLEEAEAELAREKEEKKARKAAKRAAKKNGGALPEEQTEAATDQTAGAVSETSAEASEAEENARALEGEAENTAQSGAADAKNASVQSEKKGSSPLMIGIMVAAVVIAVVMMVVLFIWLPTFIFGLLTKAAPVLLFPESPALASLVKSAFEGFFKVVLLVGYMSLVSLMKDIRRTFEYHGAEHKTIFCYEHGKALTVANVRAERRFHPRCGTSFLILMVLVSIFVCFFIDPIAILATGAPLVGWLRTAVRLVLLPLIMGLGYEVLKFAGRHENWFTRIVSAPGMWLQHITVREPDDEMIECAIMAFKAVIPEEEIAEEEAKIAAESGECASTQAESGDAETSDTE